MTPTVLITGANRGIGLELCKQYKQQGCDVIGLCRKSSDELIKTDVTVVENIDVRSTESILRFCNSFDKKINILINNAGIMKSEQIGNMTEQSYDQLMEQIEVNAIGPIKVTNLLLPKLAKNSKVILITSRMGSISDNSSGGKYGYRMSKAALNAAGKSLAIDLADRHISVGIIHPGWVQTDMTAHSGLLSAENSASDIMKRIDELSISSSGTFQHSNGTRLDW